MTIALIVPFYNSEQYLHRCLLSLYEQTEDYDEIILVDDGSTDRSHEIAMYYANNARGKWMVVKKEHTGVSDARNLGLDMVTADYVTFLDSDDELLPDACTTMKRAINELGDKLDIIQFEFYKQNIRTKQNTHQKLHKCTYSLKRNSIAGMPKYWQMVWNKVFNQKAWKRFCFKSGLQFGEDELFVIDMLLNDAEMATYQKPTVIKHYDNEESICHGLNLELLKRQDDALMGRMLDEMQKTHFGDYWHKIKAIVDLIEEHHHSRAYKMNGWEEKHE